MTFSTGQEFRMLDGTGLLLGIVRVAEVLPDGLLICDFAPDQQFAQHPARLLLEEFERAANAGELALLDRCTEGLDRLGVHLVATVNGDRLFPRYWQFGDGQLVIRP